MAELFVYFINAHYVCVCTLLFLMIVRCFLKAISKEGVVWMWGILLLRTIIPLGMVRTSFSLIPSTNAFDPINVDMMKCDALEFHTGFKQLDYFLDRVVFEDYMIGLNRSIDEMWAKVIVIGIFWLSGMIFLLVGLFRKYHVQRWSLNSAVKKEENIYMTEYARIPFVFGLLDPKIYIPYRQSSGIEMAIRHEQEHIRHHDQIWKMIGYLVWIWNWMDPLFWVAYKLFEADLENACDERLVGNLDRDQRGAYALAVLSYSQSTWKKHGTGYLFQKNRIKRIMHIQRCSKGMTRLWKSTLIILALFLWCDPIR